MHAAAGRRSVNGSRRLHGYDVMPEITAEPPVTAPELVLPRPRMTGGRPLLEALHARCSTRAFSPRELPVPLLSHLLWAACGINRPQTGGRTAPSANNWQEIDLYVALARGLYRYQPHEHRLQPLSGADIRAKTGSQDFVAVAPVNLIYVADLTRIDVASGDERRFYSGADTGFIAQNVYLFCASEGLGTVARGLIERRTLAQVMGLDPRQRVLMAQCVGYPA